MEPRRYVPPRLSPFSSPNASQTNNPSPDHEIFRLRDEIEASEGPDVTFYDFLGVARNANQDDLKAALKKKSRTMHPDKVKRSFVASKSTGKPAKGDKPGVHVSKGPSPAEVKAAHKAASDRWARIQLVKKVLEGAGRARYDHFLANGFPKWKGTGYYYARFRPGLGSVLLGLFVFVGGAGHYIALYMSWKRQQEFVGRYIKFARHAAWGDNLVIPGVDSAAGRRSGNNTPPATDSDAEAMQPMNRRQRRMQEKDARKEKPEKKSKAPKAKQPSPADTPTSITGPKKRVVAENGKILVVDAVGNVYLEQKNDEGETQEFLLDVSSPLPLHFPSPIPSRPTSPTSPY